MHHMSESHSEELLVVWGGLSKLNSPKSVDLVTSFAESASSASSSTGKSAGVKVSISSSKIIPLVDRSEFI